MEAYSSCYAGLDIGGTKCSAIIGKVPDGSGDIKILEKKVLKTDTSISPYEMLARLDTLLGPMFEKYPVKAIGVSCGGPLDSERGIIMSPPNLPGWDNVCITEYLSKNTVFPRSCK